MRDRFGLYLIATNPLAGYESIARAAVECGVRYLQLRMKDAPQSEIVATARKYRAITNATDTLFIVNDDPGIAMEVDADGVHLGQSDQSIAEARRAWSIPGKIFGLSTHTMEQAVRAAAQHPDYVGIGPVFPTQTKADVDPVLGPTETGRIAEHLPVTPVAIGGINAENLPRLLDVGVENFCVVGAVNSAADPVTAIRTLQKIWKKHLF